MCRIVGIVDFKQSLGIELEPLTSSMRDSMEHGGPDDAGLYISDDKKVALGHRRLSIIDTSFLGHQPMSNQDKSIWITYNGEIYNFQELKNELIKYGDNFKSKTDTEVLLYGYEKWGIEKLLSRLRGMFAFVIYDQRKDLPFLVLARDRFGIKPLYYFQNEKFFIFASEVKAILKSKLVPDEKNMKAISGFLQLGSVPAPLTTVKNVFSLPSGHYMVVQNETLSLNQYWDLSSCFKNPPLKNITLDEVVETSRKLLLESVKLHLVSDVPLGFFLSGGIDSSALVALGSDFYNEPKLFNTLSVVFEEEDYNEAKYAKQIADLYKTNHREVLIKSKDFFDELPNIFSAMDEPTIDGVNTYFISKAAKEAGLTVVLSGLGGDELFLGYDHFKKAKKLELPLYLFKFLPMFLRKGSMDFLQCFNGKGLKKLEYLSSPTNENVYMAFRGLFTPSEVQRLLGVTSTEMKEYELNSILENGFYAESLTDYLDYFDFKHYLQNQLLKDSDFMSMKHAVELRVPFLDHVLVEYVTSIPLKLKLSEKINKHLLVKALKDKLPHGIWDRGKMGFTFPFEKWIKSNKKLFQELILDKSFIALDSKEVEKIWEGFERGQFHWSRIWAIIVMASGKFTLAKSKL